MPKTKDFKTKNQVNQVKKTDKSLDKTHLSEDLKTSSGSHDKNNSKVKNIEAGQITEQQLKRRPGRNEAGISKPKVESPYKVVDVENLQKESLMETQDQNQAEGQSQAEVKEPLHSEIKSESQTQSQTQSQAQTDSKSKVEITFPGSEVIRSRFPLPFEIAEVVAADWINNGNFENLPVQHPLGKTVATKGLKKAKELEQKIMTSPTTEKAAMAVFGYAMKAQGIFNEIKSKVSRKN